MLAGLWEFPSLELSSLNTDYLERSRQTTEFLKKRYGIELNDPKRHDLGNVIHLFSHIRKVYHVEWIQYKSDEEFMDTENVKWVTLAELDNAPIPTALKKALRLFEKSKVKKQNRIEIQFTYT